jgi:hypothetical protein
MLSRCHQRISCLSWVKYKILVRGGASLLSNLRILFRFRGMIHTSNIFSAMPSALLGTRFLIHEPCAAFPLHPLVHRAGYQISRTCANPPSQPSVNNTTCKHFHLAFASCWKQDPQITSQVSFPSFPCLRSPVTLHFGQAGTGAERELIPELEAQRQAYIQQEQEKQD